VNDAPPSSDLRNKLVELKEEQETILNNIMAQINGLAAVLQ
jgi:hypothetical protein